MKETISVLFAEKIKKFLDNILGQYNLGVMPDVTAHRLFNEMIAIAMINAGLTRDDYDKVIDITRSYTDAGINNKEMPDLVGEITKLVTK